MLNTHLKNWMMKKFGWNYLKLTWINLFYLTLHKDFFGRGCRGVGFPLVKKRQSWKVKYFQLIPKDKVIVGGGEDVHHQVLCGVDIWKIKKIKISHYINEFDVLNEFIELSYFYKHNMLIDQNNVDLLTLIKCSNKFFIFKVGLNKYF